MANEEIDPRLRESTGTLAQNTTSTPIAPHPYATYAQAGSPDLNPYSNSPQSIAPAIAHGNHGDQEAGSSDAKRVRACERKLSIFELMLSFIDSKQHVGV